MNIYEAINKSITEMPSVGKDSKNTTQGWSFRSIDAIIDHTKKIIAANGICIFPKLLKKEVRVDMIDKKGYVQRLTTANLEIEYKLVSKFDSSFETVILCGESQDYADKAVGQAETFAFKSMLSKVFILGFEEDPDLKTTDTSSQKAEPKKNESKTPETKNIVKEHFQSLPREASLLERGNDTIRWINENTQITIKSKAFETLITFWKSIREQAEKNGKLEEWSKVFNSIPVETKEEVK